MNLYILVLFLALGLTLVLAACGSREDLSTGTEKTKESSDAKISSKKDDGSKTIDASQHKTEALGMKINLGDIKIMKDKINVGMNIKNTTDSELNFYPDQGKAVVGSMQLEANLFMIDGSIGGEWNFFDVKPYVIIFGSDNSRSLNIHMKTLTSDGVVIYFFVPLK